MLQMRTTSKTATGKTSWNIVTLPRKFFSSLCTMRIETKFIGIKGTNSSYKSSQKREATYLRFYMLMPPALQDLMKHFRGQYPCLPQRARRAKLRTLIFLKLKQVLSCLHKCLWRATQLQRRRTQQLRPQLLQFTKQPSATSPWSSASTLLSIRMLLVYRILPSFSTFKTGTILTRKRRTGELLSSIHQGSIPPKFS